MNNEIEEQIKIINEFKKNIYTSSEHTYNLEMILKDKITELKKICTHDYIAEHNGDCHSSGYYYTCINCNHFCTKRPEKYRFN